MNPDAIAGHSLTTPRPEYRASLPGGGALTLRRGGGYYAQFTASLSLSGEDAVALPGPSMWFDSFGSSETGYHALIVTHRVLERPELLEARGPALDAKDPAAQALARCRTRLADALARPHSAAHRYACPDCLKALQTAHVRSVASSRYLSVTEDCRHVAPYARGLARVVAAHPELALEFAGLIVPAGDRFVLRAEVFQTAVTEWLLGVEEARQRVDRWGYYGRRWAPRPRRRWSAAGNEALPTRSREAVIYAAEAWSVVDDAPRFGWDPSRPTDPPTWDLDAPRPPRELALLVPEAFREQAPEPSPPQAVVAEITTKRTTKRTPKKTAEGAAQATPRTTFETAAPGVAPAGVFTRKDLEALGHTPAAQKRMLAAGVLVRDGFGWYRFARAPG